MNTETYTEFKKETPRFCSQTHLLWSWILSRVYHRRPNLAVWMKARVSRWQRGVQCGSDCCFHLADTANILACYEVNQSLLEHLIFSLRDLSPKTRTINFIAMVHLFSCPRCQRPQGKFFREKNFSTCAPPKTFWFTDSMFPNYYKGGHFLKHGICVSLWRVKRKRNNSVVLFIFKEHIYC